MKNNIKLWTTFLSGSILLGCVSDPQISSTAPDTLLKTARPEAAQKEYQLGKQYHLEHQLDSAEEKYLYALVLDPAHLGAQHAMAIIHASRGDLNRAIELLTILSNTYPDKSYIFANLGHAYFLKGDFKRAQDALDHATMLDPENIYAWNELELVIAAINRSKLPRSVAINDVPDLQSGLRTEITELAPGFYKMDYAGAAAMQSVQTSTAIVASQTATFTNTTVPMPSSILPVELVNGNGVPGLLRQVKALLPENQWKVIRMTNHDQFKIKTTRIEYHEPDYAAAKRLADHMGVNAELTPNYRDTDSGLRVILGHDFRNVDRLRKRLVCQFSGSES